MTQSLKRVLIALLKPLRSYGMRLFGAQEVLLEEMPDAPELFKHYRMLIQTEHLRVPGGWIFGGEFYSDCMTVGGNFFRDPAGGAKVQPRHWNRCWRKLLVATGKHVDQHET